MSTNRYSVTSWFTRGTLPVIITFFVIGAGGLLLLERAEHQARDTIRKHHLEDIEQSLYFARSIHGTTPPYGQAQWCGLLNDPANSEVRAQIEQALRQQNEKYANPSKPFPSDPLINKDLAGYFYWKHSPTYFELLAVLEEDPTGERDTKACDNAAALTYDYGINSAWRQRPDEIVTNEPL